ncbi:tRNA glutamyl-Q(34) synthetase GluQRS [Shewanella corallii]|uniref:Glutamyl-Q tRNA(Asp) synthetase n=1 Tax=Shewanella corallii TaxID=560080 RepID=A0ABT0N348_9GAMM|nr:tRNA glutamyl-Q(34) synthetase GluQRS [Shewanella corallii]MCL2912520.1 tRNA glutamyl-Q(34) synthetase GluQRS [Shewanella corallii]
MNNTSYVGRFAPSPSGSLHFGSLVAALGSYLRARSQNGQWLLRVEDIDPPREVPGAADDILYTLERFGLEWDGNVLYQSQRLDAYEAYLQHLLADEQAYYCQCTRKQIKAMGGTYDGRCGRLIEPLKQGAIRIRNQAAVARFDDQLMGEVTTDQAFAGEDFIIKRSDGLYAYQLAVVMDDAFQGITEVVRGADLLEATVRQISLYQQFGLQQPTWLHLPLASLEPGFKLSKQNHATPVDPKSPQKALQAALAFLGQQPVATESDVRLMLAQAVSQFDLSNLPRQREILLNPD